MFRYIRAMFSWVSGWFGAGADRLAENKHVMSATYDAAIKNRQNRFETVKNAVAELIGVQQGLTEKVKEFGVKISKLNTIKTGAQVAMQKRIETLKGSKTKEEILSDAEFIKHKAAYEDAASTLSEVQSRFDEKNHELETKKGLIAKYKAELQTMQRQNESLKDEKSEAIADVGIAQQQEAINSLLNGIPQDTADSDLAKAREARKRVTNRAAVTTELAGNDAKLAENEYLKFAEQAKSNTELDNLLNWGDDKTAEPLSPAKIPE